MNSGLVLLVVGGFLLGGAWSVWQVDEDSPERGIAQAVFAVVLLVAALVASAAGALRLI